MRSQQIKAIIEGLLFVSGEEGIEEKQIMDVLQLDRKSVRFYMNELINLYQSESRGLQIVEIAGGYQFTTKPEHAPFYRRLVQTPSTTTLSQAALEVLAIIAYNQPISRIEIEDIRGVKSERPIRTLIAKSLIKEVGRSDGPGRAILYGTTKDFLEQFGLSSLEELPPLPDNIPEEEIIEEIDLFYAKYQEEMQEEQEAVEEATSEEDGAVEVQAQVEQDT